MESGYAWRPITVRREGPQTLAQSVMGTFVSGNYFRVFGLTPAAGRLFVDADDQKGAPIYAVMNYEPWQQDFSADPSVIGASDEPTSAKSGWQKVGQPESEKVGRKSGSA